MNDAVVALSGRRGAGKTTIGEHLAELLHWPFVSFGDYLRSVARTRGRPQSDAVLMDLGERIVKADAAGLVTAVLDTRAWRTGQPIVIDGLRHTKVRELLRARVGPLPLYHVHVEVTESVRLARLRANNEPTAPEIDAHSTEEEVLEELPASADLRISGEGDPLAIARALLARLGAV